jgi:hypothetical protein
VVKDGTVVLGRDGEFTVRAEAADPESGVVRVGFGALGAGWSGGGDDTAPPFETTYRREALASVPATVPVTAFNGAGSASATTGLPLTEDAAGPELGADCAGSPCEPPEAELYEIGDAIALRATDAGAGVREIRYTLDGSEPTAAHGSVYTAPLSVTAGTTLVTARGFDRVGNGGEPLILLVRSADPLTVAPVLDTGRRVTKTVPTTGGSLEATAANGTTYELSIPAGALAGEAEISMTPVTGAGGLPFAGGVAGGVQLAPDGLELHEPAVLRIAPPAGTMPSPTTLALFAYHGDGESFHLYPPAPNAYGGWEAQAVSMRIRHFSGYGAAPSTEAERDGVAARAPATDRDELEQAAAEPMTDVRSCALGGGGCTLDEKFKAIALAKFPLVMAQIAGAPPTREGYDSAYGAGMGWLHEVKVVMGEHALPDETAAITGALTGLLKRSFDAAVRRCRSGGLAAVEDILFFARQGQLFGLPESELDAAAAVKCVVFEVEVDSAFRLDHTSRNASDQVTSVEKQRLHAKATATLRPLADQAKARAVPDFSEATYTQTQSTSDFHYDLVRVAGDMAVGPLRFDLNAGTLGGRGTSLMLGDGGGTSDPVAGIVRWPTEIWDVTTFDEDRESGVLRNRTEGLWGKWWDRLHTSERVSDDYLIFELRGFSGGATQITKTYERDRHDLGYDTLGETTTVTVTHAPE